MILPRTEADDLKNEIIVDITTTIIAAHLPTAILKYKLCALIYKCKSSQCPKMTNFDEFGLVGVMCAF